MDRNIENEETKNVLEQNPPDILPSEEKIKFESFRFKRVYPQNDEKSIIKRR